MEDRRILSTLRQRHKRHSRCQVSTLEERGAMYPFLNMFSQTDCLKVQILDCPRTARVSELQFPALSIRRQT